MQPDAAADPAGAPVGGASVRTGSVARLAAEVASAGLAFVAGLVTAKSLGPDGKGLLATMSYVAVIAAACGGLGLGEAGVTQSARGVRDLQATLSTSITAAAISSTVATGVFLGVVMVRYGSDLDTLAVATAAIGVSIPMIVGTSVLNVFLYARGGFLPSAVARVAMAFVTAAASVLFVPVMEKDVSGAAVAFGMGWSVSLAIVLVGLRRVGFSLRPRFDRGYLAVALRFGLPVQVSYLLTVLATRIDLLLVDRISGIVDAGRYSVALTVGSVVTYAPAILAGTSYARIAGADATDVRAMIGRVSRLAVLVTALASGVLMLLTPVALPWAFGEGYRGAVAPAVILLAAGPAWAAQWTLCRARAARGDGRVLLRSFATSVLTMVVLDVALIPGMGIVGAALAYGLSTVVGLAVAFAALRGGDVRGWADLLVPRRTEVDELLGLVTSARRRARSATG